MTDLEALREMLASANENVRFTGGPKSQDRARALVRAIALIEACERLDQVAAFGPSGVVRVLNGFSDGWVALEPAMGPVDTRKTNTLDALLITLAGEYV